MNAPAEQQAVTKIHRMVDVKIECDPPSHLNWYMRRHGLAAYEQELRRWVRDFEDFIRDHRSQDPVSLTVVPQWMDLCSKCGNEWEEMFDEDDGLHKCASCGRPIEVTK